MTVTRSCHNYKCKYNNNYKTTTRFYQCTLVSISLDDKGECETQVIE